MKEFNIYIRDSTEKEFSIYLGHSTECDVVVYALPYRVDSSFLYRLMIDCGIDHTTLIKRTAGKNAIVIDTALDKARKISRAKAVAGISLDARIEGTGKTGRMQGTTVVGMEAAVDHAACLYPVSGENAISLSAWAAAVLSRPRLLRDMDADPLSAYDGMTLDAMDMIEE